MIKVSQRIAPCLWFDNQAEEAAKFYVSIFPNSRIGNIARYGKAGFEHHGRAEGSVMTVEFFLDGQCFTALNAGPMFKFSEAISFQIACADQKEIDTYWNALGTAGGGLDQPCGWVKDKFGLSWQVVPANLGEIMSGMDSARMDRAMAVIFQMQKLDLAAIERAAG